MMASLLTRFADLENVKEVGVRFVDDSGKITRLSYAELISNARQFASAVRSSTKPGEPVILVMTEPQSAITAILGCMIANSPPAPIYPPQNLKSVPAFQNFVRHVAAKSKATLIISDPQIYPFLRSLDAGPTIRSIEKTSTFQKGSTKLQIDHRNGSEIAFLQFTSGSTSTPKGVMVMQEGLQANLEMIRAASYMSEQSCVVTWLPVYHDMGLIGTVLNAITLSCELVVLPPLTFLKHPRRWLELITALKGTHTAAPNFAFGLCVRRIPDVSGLDLSSMTTFICGAEPILPKTMEDFVAHFHDAQLNPCAMVPAYGLAEATLAVTFTPYLRGLLTDEVDFRQLTESRIAQNANRSATIRVPSCGLPLQGVEIRIANDGEILPERKVGEIQLRGPSITPGYIGDEVATQESRSADGWLKTGDLGYLHNGELYPCGRIKDVIIIRGKNFHAHDLETIASQVHGVRVGNVVAFSLPSSKGEGLVIVAETRSEGRAAEIGRNIRSHLAESLGITAEEILVVSAGTLPKTSSGKLKRSETRTLFESGSLLKQTSKFSALHSILKSGMSLLKKK